MSSESDMISAARVATVSDTFPVSDVTPSADVVAALPISLSEPTEFLPALTALRFPAAAMVVIAHCGGLFGLSEFVWQFSQAVTFFFVLSGFVLMCQYPALSGRDVRQFYRNRAARIWPLYLVGCALILALDPTSRGVLNPVSLPAALLLVHEWVLFSGSWELLHMGILGAGWTLSTLLALYLLFPLWVRSFQRTWWIKLIVSLVVVAEVILLCDHTIMGEASFVVGPYTLSRWVYKHFSVRLFEFTLGMVAATWFMRLRHKWKLSTARATLLELAAVLGVALSVGVLSRVFAYAAVGVSWSLVTWFADGGVTAIFLAALLFALAFGRGLLARLLSTAPLVLLGEISYAIYILHTLYLRYYRLRAKAFPDLPTIVLFAYFAALVLLASHIAWASIERPARRWLRGRRGSDHPLRAPKLKVDPALAKTSDPADETLSKPAPSFWNLMNPRPGLIVCEAVVLVVMTAVWIGLAHARPNITVIEETGVEAILATARPETKNVNFSDKFLLLGVQMIDHPDGLQLCAVWKSLEDQDLLYTVQIHMLDHREGDPISRASYPQDVSRRHVAKGTVWQDKGFIPNAKLRGAKFIGIGLNRTDEMLIAQDGLTDWEGKRLLMPIQRKVPVAPAKPAKPAMKPATKPTTKPATKPVAKPIAKQQP